MHLNNCDAFANPVLQKQLCVLGVLGGYRSSLDRGVRADTRVTYLDNDADGARTNRARSHVERHLRLPA